MRNWTVADTLAGVRHSLRDPAMVPRRLHARSAAIFDHYPKTWSRTTQSAEGGECYGQ